jgi:hypothetical protein
MCYGLAAYSFGEAFSSLASPAAVVLGLAAMLMILAVPALILRYEKRLAAHAADVGVGRRDAPQSMSA